MTVVVVTNHHQHEYTNGDATTDMMLWHNDTRDDDGKTLLLQLGTLNLTIVFWSDDDNISVLTTEMQDDDVDDDELVEDEQEEDSSSVILPQHHHHSSSSSLLHLLLPSPPQARGMASPIPMCHSRVVNGYHHYSCQSPTTCGMEKKEESGDTLAHIALRWWSRPTWDPAVTQQQKRITSPPIPPRRYRSNTTGSDRFVDDNDRNAQPPHQPQRCLSSSDHLFRSMIAVT